MLKLTAEYAEMRSYNIGDADMISLSPRRIAIFTATFNPVELKYTRINEKDVRKYMKKNPPPDYNSCDYCINREWDMKQWAHTCNAGIEYCGKEDPCSRYISTLYTMEDFINDLHASGAFNIPNDTPQEMVSYIEDLLGDLI